jgi:hypothetical protein
MPVKLRINGIVTSLAYILGFGDAPSAEIARGHANIIRIINRLIIFFIQNTWIHM